MKLRIDTFNGIQPRLHPSLLANGMATRAHNCRLKNGKLVPLKTPARSEHNIIYGDASSQISGAHTIYLWHRRNGRKDFLAWSGIVRVAQSNLADDSRYRLFVSGETGVNGGEPAFFAANERDDGYVVRPLIKAALARPSISAVGDLDEDDVRYAVWYQTWVDAFGQESPVSYASEEVAYSDGQAIRIASVAAPTHAVKRRFYKSVAGSTETSDGIRFVYEQDVQGGFFQMVEVSVKDEDCGEEIPEIEAPPSDLRDMQYVSGAFYAGWSPSMCRTVMLSDVNRPYSWPVGYRYDVRDDIVGIAPVQNSVYALTKGYPSVLQGYAPESMTVTDLSSRQGCVSSRSIVVAEGSVFYASADGLCQINPSSSDPLQVRVVTDKYFTKEQWMALAPETCMCEVHDNAIFAWFSPVGGEPSAYIFDLMETACAITTHDVIAQAATYDCEEDKLFYVGNGEV